MADVKTIKIEMLTQEAFEPFGQVIAGNTKPVDFRGSGVSNACELDFQTEGTPRVK
jgi:ureidoglycolate hydrolase